MSNKSNIKMTKEEKKLWNNVINYLVEKEYEIKSIPRSYFINNYEYKLSLPKNKCM